MDLKEVYHLKGGIIELWQTNRPEKVSDGLIDTLLMKE
jgi:predicted sulfurtransferase